MLVNLFTVATLNALVTRVAVFFVGCVLSLLSVFALKYLTTSAYHNQTEAKSAVPADQQQLVSAAAADHVQFQPPTLYPAVSSH